MKKIVNFKRTRKNMNLRAAQYNPLIYRLLKLKKLIVPTCTIEKVFIFFLLLFDSHTYNIILTLYLLRFQYVFSIIHFLPKYIFPLIHIITNFSLVRILYVYECRVCVHIIRGATLIIRRQFVFPLKRRIQYDYSILNQICIGGICVCVCVVSPRIFLV